MLKPTISARIYLQDHFPSIKLKDLAEELIGRYGILYGTRIHLMCEDNAMAIIPTNQSTVAGLNPENLAVLEKESNIATFVNEFTDVGKKIIHRWDNITFWVPHSEYSVELLLPPGETSRRFIQIKAHVCKDDLSRLTCRLHSPTSAWPTATIVKIEGLVQAWAMEAIYAPGFGGENFRSPPKFVQTEGRYVSIIPIDRENVIFPWIELYLRLRQNLPKRDWPQYMSFNKHTL